MACAQGRTGRVILDFSTFQEGDAEIKVLAEAGKAQSGQFTAVWESNSYWAADAEESKHRIVFQNTQYLINSYIRKAIRLRQTL